MTKERARLSEQITLVTQRQKETQDNIWREETHIAEQMDNVRWRGDCVLIARWWVAHGSAYDVMFAG
jgi:hypothetical protein